MAAPNTNIQGIAFSAQIRQFFQQQAFLRQFTRDESSQLVSVKEARFGVYDFTAITTPWVTEKFPGTADGSTESNTLDLSQTGIQKFADGPPVVLSANQLQRADYFHDMHNDLTISFEYMGRVAMEQARIMAVNVDNYILGRLEAASPASTIDKSQTIANAAVGSAEEGALVLEMLDDAKLEADLAFLPMAGRVAIMKPGTKLALVKHLRAEGIHYIDRVQEGLLYMAEPPIMVSGWTIYEWPGLGAEETAKGKTNNVYFIFSGMTLMHGIQPLVTRTLPVAGSSGDMTSIFIRYGAVVYNPAWYYLGTLTLA